MIAAPWHKVAVPQNEIVEFLGVFARFEFALKYAGYRGVSANNSVTANWDTFAAAVAARFNKAATPQLTTAVDYLIQHPPRRQDVDAATGALVFSVVQHDQNKTELEQAIICVRRVRNNLFHGGKFVQEAGPNRDATLVRSCMLLLDAALPLDANVRQAFDMP